MRNQALYGAETCLIGDYLDEKGQVEDGILMMSILLDIVQKDAVYSMVIKRRNDRRMISSASRQPDGHVEILVA